MDRPPIILFLGNEIMGDDRIGLLLGRTLKKELEEKGFEVEILETTGLPLVDYLSDRPLAIIVDSMVTGRFKPGTVVTFKPEEFKVQKRFSAHYAGIPEALELMKALRLNPPEEVLIVGVEVVDPFKPSSELTPIISEAFDEIKDRVLKEIMKVCS